MADFFVVGDEEMNRLLELFLLQRLHGLQQDGYTGLVIEISGFDKPVWKNSQFGFYEDEISDTDAQGLDIINALDLLIDDHFHGLLFSFQRARVSSIDVDGRLVCLDRSTDEFSLRGSDPAVL